MSDEERPADGAPPEHREHGEARKPSAIETNLKSRSTWLRFLLILVFGALYALTRIVVFAVVVLQFLWVLFTSERNRRLTDFGHSLALYTAEVIDYLCFVTDLRPFPFDRDWPDGSSPAGNHEMGSADG